MEKIEARKKYLDLRKTISESSLSLKSLAIANAILSMNIWNLETFHVFLPIKKHNEVDTFPLIEMLLARNKTVVAPRVVGSLNAVGITPAMEHLLYEKSKTATNNYGIIEPAGNKIIDPKKIDVVFLPLLAFDKVGNRVGYGKGFYDVFLSECRPDAVKIGLSFFQAEEIIESNENDIPLDYCVTPEKLYVF